MSEPSDTIRSRHRNVGGSCSRCIKPFGNSWQPVSWPCDVIVIREADRADAEKERADKTADVLAHVEDDLNALLCNGPEERVWLEYKHERDKLRNALTMSESAVKEFLGEATALTAERDAEKERADKAEAALAEMRPLYAAAGDDAWQRCIERDELRNALTMSESAVKERADKAEAALERLRIDQPLNATQWYDAANAAEAALAECRALLDD